MHKLRYALIATAQLAATLVGLLLLAAAVSLTLGALEGLGAGTQSFLEWVAGGAAFTGIIFGLAMLWRHFYRRQVRRAAAEHRRRTSLDRPLRHPVPVDGYVDPYDGAYVTGTGRVVRGTHKPGSCAVPDHCSIHHPSDHKLRAWPTNFVWGRMVRVCLHGISHPDPDQMAFDQNRVDKGERTQEQVDRAQTHECDGCCGADPEDMRRRLTADMMERASEMALHEAMLEQHKQARLDPEAEARLDHSAKLGD